MSTHRHIDAICIGVLVCTLLLTVLFMNGKALGLRTAAEVEAGEETDSPWFTANDRDGNWIVRISVQTSTPIQIASIC